MTLALILVALRGSACALDEPLVIPFETDGARSVILLRAEVYDRPALLILDTGSARTFLRPELVGIPVDVLPSSPFAEGPGLLARGRWSLATLRLGAKTWPHRRVISIRFDEVSRAYERQIDGILGQDVLREFRTVTIDYEAKLLRLSR